MSIVVMKFGGTSVADATKVRNAARRAVEAKRDGNQVVMVVSARGKKTDELVRLAEEITDSPTPREMDMLLSTGEQESVALMAMAVHELGENAISFTGGQIGLRTDDSHTKARIVRISTTRMREQLDAGNVVIAAGFQGVDEHLNITTLGRGGSDTTATALAAALGASLCEIYTDVEGVFTTDPRICEDARLTPRISYDEMLELASLGAGVMHARSIEFAKKYRVPIRVRPSFADGAGTLIAPEEPEDNMALVAGVALVPNEARVSLVEIPDEPGVMQLVFAKMSDRKIPIDMVVQNVGTGGTANVSFTVPQDDLAETLTAASEAIGELGSGSVTQGTNLAKVSVVGAGMRTHTGVACQMFKSLADAGININIVTTSEIKISVLVSRDDCKDAVRAVHAGFGLENVACANPAVGVRAEPVETRPGTSEAEDEIVAGLNAMEDIVVSDVQLDDTQSRITLSHLPDEPGIVAKLFAAVGEGGVMVDMIVQNVARSEGANVSFTVPRTDLERSLLLSREVLDKWPAAEVTHDREIAKLSVMGIGLRSHTEVGARMFRALSESNINVQMINTSEIRISAVVGSDQGRAAVACLTSEFGLTV